MKIGSARLLERYDGDGYKDMPGLRWPVTTFEIGTEFSSYQPEPVEDYLETLSLAYTTAHKASDSVKIAHAAFLLTPVNMDVQDPSEYDRVWAKTPRRDKHHGLEDMRRVLDHPELFDLINFHNLGSPYEIEHVIRWLKVETSRRNYRKPVIISDTLCTSYNRVGTSHTVQREATGFAELACHRKRSMQVGCLFQKIGQQRRRHTGMDPRICGFGSGANVR